MTRKNLILLALVAGLSWSAVPAYAATSIDVDITCPAVTVTNTGPDPITVMYVVSAPTGVSADAYRELEPGEAWTETGFERTPASWVFAYGHWADMGPKFTGWVYEHVAAGTWDVCDPVPADTIVADNGAVLTAVPQVIENVQDDTTMVRSITVTPTVAPAEDDPTWDCATMGNRTCGFRGVFTLSTGHKVV